MSNSLNQTLFNKYSDILEPLQICQVGEYPYVKIHNVVGSNIPVKKINNYGLKSGRKRNTGEAVPLRRPSYNLK